MPKHPNAIYKIPKVVVIDWVSMTVTVVNGTKELMEMVDQAEQTGHHTTFLHESGGEISKNIPECWQDD